MQTQKLRGVRNKHGTCGTGISGICPLQEGGNVGQKKLRQCARSGERVLAVVGVPLDRVQDEYANDPRAKNCA